MAYCWLHPRGPCCRYSAHQDSTTTPGCTAIGAAVQRILPLRDACHSYPADISDMIDPVSTTAARVSCQIPESLRCPHTTDIQDNSAISWRECWSYVHIERVLHTLGWAPTQKQRVRKSPARVRKRSESSQRKPPPSQKTWRCESENIRQIFGTWLEKQRSKYAINF